MFYRGVTGGVGERGSALRQKRPTALVRFGQEAVISSTIPNTRVPALRCHRRVPLTSALRFHAPLTTRPAVSI
ncbi:hypothetical protein SAMCFNEI73_Ch2335 [Sinorhizobium americanum]|uniref:Uncharacterized protein n=1 Tax=Sinorhizobium americanum TaxID=194963 RepID=A0A1L3LNF4_9HYPH|nr:hypothetical protein SAMCFNEI73_Ch2335 [Sinorhizobium americanum]